MSTPGTPRIDRRVAIKWMLTAAAALTVVRHPAFGAASAPTAAAPSGRGYGTDPELNKSYNPGDFWPLTLTEAQRRAVTALCDTIVPADEKSGSASSVGVPDFIDEWISAPYPEQQQDRAQILEGLAWIEAESRTRFEVDFAAAAPAQQTALCDLIHHEASADAQHRTAARFFNRFRDLTLGGFYTTPAGLKDLGYIGNIPQGSFDGPPAELIARLGLD